VCVSGVCVWCKCGLRIRTYIRPQGQHDAILLQYNLKGQQHTGITSKVSKRKVGGGGVRAGQVHRTRCEALTDTLRPTVALARSLREARGMSRGTRSTRASVTGRPIGVTTTYRDEHTNQGQAPAKLEAESSKRGEPMGGGAGQRNRCHTSARGATEAWRNTDVGSESPMESTPDTEDSLLFTSWSWLIDYGGATQEHNRSNYVDDTC
jgi:hypothetical protein